MTDDDRLQLERARQQLAFDSVRLTDIGTARTDKEVNTDPITPDEFATITADPLFERLAKNLFIAYIAALHDTDFQDAETAYHAVMAQRNDDRLGIYWYSLAVMVDQQVLKNAAGETLFSLVENRIDNYMDDDLLPHYLLYAYIGFQRNLGLPEYHSVAGDIDPTSEIGLYWRWLAQLIRNEFEFLNKGPNPYLQSMN